MRGDRDRLRSFEGDVAQESARMSAAARRRYRVDHGLCPQCGKEAAPFYLCHDCRSHASVRRMLNTMNRRGILDKITGGREHLWHIDKAKTYNDTADFRWQKYLLEMDADDKRRRPRINRRPVDLDEVLMGIFRASDQPLQIEEIYQAWGRLRSRRKTATLAGDMARIIAAQRRRETRAAKRAARA